MIGTPVAHHNFDNDGGHLWFIGVVVMEDTRTIHPFYYVDFTNGMDSCWFSYLEIVGMNELYDKITNDVEIEDLSAQGI
jgi:hypothetical protein